MGVRSWHMGVHGDCADCRGSRADNYSAGCPYKKQGRVFGFAQAFESAAAPITAFIVAPIAEFLIIPYMNSAEGKGSLGWLLGEGEARGIALVFLFSGVIMVLAACMAFMTKSYVKLAEHYQKS